MPQLQGIRRQLCRKDDRIRSHVLLFLLAYYVYWHMQQRPHPLFEKDSQGKDREWTMENGIKHWHGIRKQRVSVASTEFDPISQPTEQTRTNPGFARNQAVAIPSNPKPLDSLDSIRDYLVLRGTKCVKQFSFFFV
jgi:hypothetical protein